MFPLELSNNKLYDYVKTEQMKFKQFEDITARTN